MQNGKIECNQIFNFWRATTLCIFMDKNKIIHRSIWEEIEDKAAENGMRYE